MDFKCDKCKREIFIEDLGILAPINDSDECHPFLEMQTLCKKCYEK